MRRKWLYEDVVKRYPKIPAALPEEYQKIWDEHYLDSRNGRTVATKAASGMERWLHKKVAKTASSYGSVLEIGAGTLNQLNFENVPKRDSMGGGTILLSHLRCCMKIREGYHKSEIFIATLQKSR